jgi:PAS domain S-box-containing protein
LTRLVATLVLVACVAAAAAAAEVVRYGGDRDFPPFEYLDERGVPRGFQVDLLRELATAAGLEVAIRLDDWATIERDFRAGKLDVIALSRTRSRGDWAAFARGHATPVLGVYGRAAELDPASLHDLAGRVIAVEDNEPMRETVASSLAGSQYRFLWVATPSATLQAVADGEAELALLPVAHGDRIIATGAVAGVEPKSLELRLQAYAFATAPGNSALLHRIDQAVEQLERSGRLEALRVEWLASHRAESARTSLEQRVARKRTVLVAGAVGATLAIALLGWGLRRRGQRIRAERARRLDAEERLRALEERLAATFEHHADAMAITEQRTGIVLDVNEAMSRLLGEERDHLLGRPLDALPHLEAARTVPLLQRLLDGDEAVDGVPVRIQDGAGRARDCVMSSTVLVQGSGPRRLWTLRDVTEQLRANEDLRDEYEALARSATEQARALAQARAHVAQTDRELSEVTSSLSRELRTPLRQIIGYTGVLREALRHGRIAEASGYADQIEGSTQRMDSMVAALIGLARAGHDELVRSAVNMTALAQDAWNNVSAGDPGHVVELRIGKLPPVNADPRLMNFLWASLLSNAFKFTMAVDAPKVAIDSFLEGGRVWFRVTDNGAGFDATQAERLFQAFGRPHSPQDPSGVGLGLAIARRIVSRHGGSIRARGAPAVGAVIEFTIDS